MDKKSTKRYLITVLVLLATGFLLFFGVMYAFIGAGWSEWALSAGQTALCALGLACLPTGSYCGFVFVGLRLIKRRELSRGEVILVCVLFPLLLLGITAAGLVLLVPSIVKAAAELIK